MPTKYILIDFENVQPEIPAAWKEECVKVKVFLGAKPKSFPAKFVLSSHRMENLEYVEFTQQGKNALDSYITLCLGELKHADPNAEFEIVSNDQGYDPLIRHLKAEGLRIVRTGQTPPQKITPIRSEVSDPKVERVVTYLRNTKAKPGTVKKLENTIASWFREKINPTEVKALVVNLQKGRFISISGIKVSYTLTKKPELRIACA